MAGLVKNKFLFLVVAIMLLIGNTTCEKNPTEPKKHTMPVLPPTASMQMDISFFKASPEASLNKTMLSKSNFIAAAARVAFINAGVILASIAPSAVFAAAISQQPVLQEDGKFHWIYSVSEGLVNFSVDLVGWIEVPDTEAVWEVFVSSTNHWPPLNRFLWYQGRSKIGNKLGWWLFHDPKSVDSLRDVLRIDWEIDDELDHELVFTNVHSLSADFGDWLKYGIELSDRFLIFFDASANRTNTIYWNAETGAGFIEWFDYNNGAKSYWDENRNDTTGPPA